MDEYHQQEQINLYVALGKIQASQELILEGLKMHFVDDKEAFAKIDQRLTNVERKINYAAGLVLALTTALSLFGASVLRKLGILS